LPTCLRIWVIVRMSMTRQRRRLLSVGGLILVIICMNLPVIHARYYHQLTGAPTAEQGVIDLASSRLDRERVYLDGQWSFYWQRLIASEPDPSAEPDLELLVPEEWSSHKLAGASLPAGGYGSYQLTLTGLQHAAPLSLSVPDFGGAYRAYVDGQLAAESGRLSTQLDQVFTSPHAQLYPVNLSPGSTHRVVIEVATTRFSGLYMTPVLDDYQRALSRNETKSSARLLLFGVALSSFCSLLLIYFVFVRRKLRSFWLPAITLLVLLRIMLTAEFYSFWQPICFFNLSYEATNELMYLVTFALKYLMIFLIQEQCSIKIRLRARLGFLVYYILLYLLYLLTPPAIYNQYLSVVVPMLTYALDLYLFFRVHRDQQQVRKFGLVVFWSALMVIVGLTVDSYYLNGKSLLDTSLVLPLLLTVFLLVISWVYAMRIGDLYDDFIESSSRLELTTRQVIRQQEYYAALSGQMDEIREIKHDIRHFVGVMTRLAEEGKLPELRRFLREYGQRVEMDQLPLFCQHTIANSIIGYYYLLAKAHSIVFSSHCQIGAQIRLSDSDLCIVLGNALENAINACRLVTESDRRFISIDAKRMNKQWLLRVENSHDGSQLTLDGQGIPVSPNDGMHHGFGLRNLRKVVESYGGFVKIEHDGQVFTLMVAVPE